MLRNCLIAISLVVAGATHARADSFSCQQAGLDACKNKPKSCCEPPPCQYKVQQTMYIMLLSLFADPHVVSCAGADVEGYVNKLAQSDTFKKLLPSPQECPPSYEGQRLEDPPGFNTHRSSGKCKTFLTRNGADFPAVPGFAANQNSQTCTELLDVNFAHENVHLAACKATDPNAAFPSADQTAVANQEIAAYAVSIGKMDDLLRHWNQRCTPTKMRKDAEKQAKRGVDALKKMTSNGSKPGKCPL